MVKGATSAGRDPTLCRNPAVARFDCKIASMPVVTAVDMALVAHLHCFRIVGAASVVMELRPREPIATTLAPARLFDRK
jgi:hypothetical protein